MAKTRKPTATEVREAARGRWVEILNALAPELSEAVRSIGSTKHFSCPVHGGENGDAFRMFDDAAETGGGVCNSCGTSRNGVSLLIWLRGWHHDQAIDEVAKVLGLSDVEVKRGRPRKSSSPSTASAKSSKPPKAAKSSEEIALARTKIVSRFREAQPDTGRIAAYLEFRGLDLSLVPVPTTLKLINSLDYYPEPGQPPDGSYPAMIAQVQHPSLGVVALHRTYLAPIPSSSDDPDNQSNYPGKADVPSPKKLSTPIYDGATMGGAVRLYSLESAKDHPNAGCLSLTEGIETALAVRQATSMPVWSCVSAAGLAAVELPAAATTVHIWADPGQAGQDAAREAAQRFTSEGRTAYILTPTPELSGRADDSGDWLDVLNHSGAEAIAAALAAVQPFSSANIQIREAPNDPHRLMELYYKAKCVDEDGRRIVISWHDSIKRYDGKRYYDVPLSYQKTRLTNFCKAQANEDAKLAAMLAEENKPAPPPFKVTTNLVSNVANALVSKVAIDPRANLLSWIGGDVDRPTSIIALQNGLLDVDAYLSGEGSGQSDESSFLLPHTPDWFSTVCLPYDFDAAATCPTWLESITYNLEEDNESIAMLQEFCGYCLTFSTDAQKFLILCGEGGAGKTVIAAGLEAILGVENVSHVGLENFGERFQLTPTLGKLANIIGDSGELDRVSEGTLKSFTGGERLMFDRKGLPPIEALPTARLIICCNDPPRIKDRSEGPYRRMIFVPFNRIIPDDKRVLGMDKPAWWERSGELPGMFLWALEGLRRLRANGGKFTIPARSTAAIEKYRRTNNTARAFLNERCRPSENNSGVAKQIIFDEYRRWCEERNCHPLGHDPFSKELKRVFPFVKDGKVYAPKKDEKGRQEMEMRRVNSYVGIELTSDELSEDEVVVDL